MIFEYPESRSQRRHGPVGYQSYESFRPWLRDEFTFRGVYCLKRETWGQVTGEFELDHFRPQVFNQQSRLEYENLVYACRRCNVVKAKQEISDPIALLATENIHVFADGSIQSRKSEAVRLIRQLDLNSPRLKKWRRMWLRIVQLAEQRDSDLFMQLVGYPSDLPDLSRLRPPQNRRKKGIQQSWFARRHRGDLPSRM